MPTNITPDGGNILTVTGEDRSVETYTERVPDNPDFENADPGIPWPRAGL